MKPDMIRSFIAIDLPADLKERLRQTSDSLSRQAPRGSVRWSRIEGIHLTLKFLGDVARTDLGQIEAALAQVCRAQAPFVFTASGLGCFPNVRRPRVLWVGIREESGALAGLQREIERALDPLGHPPERRKFHPHLTLGRVKRKVPKRDVARLGEIVANSQVGDLTQVGVQSLHLFRSDLRPTGAVYTSLATFKFGQGGEEA